MLIRPQPLNIKTSKKVARRGKKSAKRDVQRKVEPERMGTLLDSSDDVKIDVKLRIEWAWRDVKGAFRSVKRVIRNHIRWHKTLRGLYPWDGDSGMISVMQTHLRHYVEYEEKHGHSTPECISQKVASAKELIDLLERMSDPDGYSFRRSDEVDARYPDYKQKVSHGAAGTSYSGYFVPQGNGWAGEESGRDPRRGYFELIDGRYQLLESPDQTETDRILRELDEYHKETDAAYRQAEADSDADFERLHHLLKENMYSWWD